MELINKELIYTQYCRDQLVRLLLKMGREHVAALFPVYKFKTMFAVGTDTTNLYLARRFLHHPCYI